MGSEPTHIHIKVDKKRRTLNNYVRLRLYFIDMGRFIDYKANNFILYILPA